MSYKHALYGLLLASFVIVASCTGITTDPGSAEAPDGYVPSSFVRAADDALPPMDVPAIVYVGEVHDQYAYHLSQLAVITALRERGLEVSIGMEMVQTPFQRPLDQYISGGIDFETMLERTEYFDRWRYDPRHYAPILEYAREHGLPLVALNAPRELTDRVSEVGIDGLSPEERSALPETLTPLAPEYRSLLEAVFGEHQGDAADADLERFIDVQTTWDEVMGARSVSYLEENPDRVLVVLAGAQHVANGYGIPARVRNALGLGGTIVLTENERERMPGGADVYLELSDESLPDSGRLGVFINQTDAGAVIAGFADDSPAQTAGAREGDMIVRVDGREVRQFADVKLGLWDRVPGDRVELLLQRGQDGAIDELTVELH